MTTRPLIRTRPGAGFITMIAILAMLNILVLAVGCNADRSRSLARGSSSAHGADHRPHQVELVRCQDCVDRVVVLSADRVDLCLKVLISQRGRCSVEDRLNPVVVPSR